jgi:hypothetical protein
MRTIGSRGVHATAPARNDLAVSAAAPAPPRRVRCDDIHLPGTWLALAAVVVVAILSVHYWIVTWAFVPAWLLWELELAVRGKSAWRENCRLQVKRVVFSLEREFRRG